ncbi:MULTISPECIES: hypothetical protein [unclassified Mesorhizobium]|uniref:hypothetical protein n=1 Tax=unclassified Mesorhizobium TaxID=325217 RepID=UPI00104243E6|nr:MULTISPECIES: hypothetical protein [unclassified Mesorhizobium]
MSGLAIRESISQKICLAQGWFTACPITIFPVHDPEPKVSESKKWGTGFRERSCASKDSGARD